MIRTGFHPAVGWLVLITMMLLLPGEDIPDNKWLAAMHADKFVHIFMFAVLVYLFYRPFKRKLYDALPWIIAGSIAYGIAIEFIQKYWAIDRTFDVNDIIADCVGCGIGGLAVIYRRRRKAEKRQRRRSRKK